MHPNRKFIWSDRAEMLAFVQQRGFATIAAVVDGAVAVAHAPVIVAEMPDRLQFHLAVNNRLARGLDGARVTISVTAMDGYISPDWYGTENQVPTWNYLAVEIAGNAQVLSPEALHLQLALLSAEHENRMDDKQPWTMDKMHPTALAALKNGITGFELAIDDIRGTAKLSQNKTAAEFTGAVDGLARRNSALAQLMQQWRSR